MNRHLFSGAFLVGAAAIVWVAAGFWGAHILALTMTALIGAVYGVGVLELHRFRQATNTLSASLATIPENLPRLDDWLCNVHTALLNPVRLRVEGERMGLPGPALTPYLVGLLVMLGMLGTFLGMVVTLNGAVFALEGTTDLSAMRAAFSAPIRGLGLAFGTSVAGVAASAMLGLMSALSRRERLQAGQLLDTAIATTLRGFSHTHQRQETYKALQMQSLVLPAVADTLQQVMVQMERMSQQLNQRLLSNQETFHTEVKTVYSDLASSVAQSLRDSLSQSAQVAAQSIKPVMEVTMAGIATNMNRSLNALSESFDLRAAAMLTDIRQAFAGVHADQVVHDQHRLQAWTNSLHAMNAAIHAQWQETGTQVLSHQKEICTTLETTAQTISEQAQSSARHTLGEMARLTASTEDLVRSRMASEADWTQQHGERMDQVVSLLHTELEALRVAEAARGDAAVERLGDLQTALTSHLTTLGTALEQPISRLIETASQAPKAAAEVIGKLREEISNSVARDNDLLEERSRIMQTLNALLDGINHAAVEQRSVINSLVASSSLALEQAGMQFASQLDTQAEKLSGVAAHVTSSSIEVSSLSDSFSFAVRSFGESNEQLIANLQRIEAALDKSMARSDEQLAYYVAQAREVIDLSVMSQREVFEALRTLPGKTSTTGKEIGKETGKQSSKEAAPNLRKEVAHG